MYSRNIFAVWAIHLGAGLAGGIHWVTAALVLVFALWKELRRDPKKHTGAKWLWEIPKYSFWYTWGKDKSIAMKAKGWLDLVFYIFGLAVGVYFSWQSGLMEAITGWGKILL